MRFLTEFEECHTGYPFKIKFILNNIEMYAGLYLIKSYWDLDILDKNGNAIYSKLLSKWKLKAHSSYGIQKVKFIAKAIIKEFSSCIQKDTPISDDILIVKKICGTCKYWSGRRVFGCTSGNCDVIFHNKRREESCDKWEY
ncbi:MAG: hypothetical protein ABC579_07145 [Candidatus Methanosuratincola petrocarbonis]